MADEVELMTILSSPYGNRVRIALRAKGIPYTLTEADLVNKSARLLQANPGHKKIPILFHKGQPIYESGLVLEYLEDAWPETVRLLPKNAYERFYAREWADFIMRKLIEEQMAKLVSEGTLNVEEYESYLLVLETAAAQFMKEDQPYFMGAQFTVVDISFATLLPWLPILEDHAHVKFSSEFKKYPLLTRWVSNLRYCPSIQFLLAEPNNDAAYLANQFKSLLGSFTKAREDEETTAISFKPST